jgi:hypothetical protein
MFHADQPFVQLITKFLNPFNHCFKTPNVVFKLPMPDAFDIGCYTNIYPLLGYINANKNFFHNLTFRFFKMVEALTPLLALARHSI